MHWRILDEVIAKIKLWNEKKSLDADWRCKCIHKLYIAVIYYVSLYKCKGMRSNKIQSKFCTTTKEEKTGTGCDTTYKMILLYS